MRKVSFIQWLALSLLSVLAAFGFCFVNSGTVFAQPTDNKTVTFSDPRLEAVIRKSIYKPTGPIYTSDLVVLASLSATNCQISDLTGLEHYTSLRRLELHGNEISDISPLAGLTNLKYIDLSNNRIFDISVMVSDRWLPRGRVELDYNPLSAASLSLVPLLQKRGVFVTTLGTKLDWSFIPGSLIAVAGAGLAPIYYLATRRRRKWLRPTALVMGVTGAVLLALWLLQRVTWFGSVEALPVPEGIAVFLGIIACLIILTGTAVAWRWELFGGILLIVSGLIAGVAYAIWLFHAPSILILFPLVSAFLYFLSWRERPGHTTVESMEKEPSPEYPRERKPHDVLILYIVLAGPIPFPVYLFILVNRAFRGLTPWEGYAFLLAAEVGCLAFIYSILHANKYW